MCLRSIRKKKGFYKVDKNRENFVTDQNGQFYEYQGVPKSDCGSRDTEQESLMVNYYNLN